MKKRYLLLAILGAFFLPAMVWASPYAYVTNSVSDDVSIIDTATNDVVKTVSVGDFPFGVGISPDRTKVYIANVNSKSVSVISTVTKSVTKTISLSDSPYGVVFNPAGTKAYVSMGMLPGYLAVIDVANDTQEATITVGNTPTGLAINLQGTKLYAANFNGGDVSVVDLSTNSVIKTISGAGNFLHDAVINSSGTRLYVAATGSNYISVIDTSSDLLLSTISTGVLSGPIGVALNPSGSLLYVANDTIDEVMVINTANNLEVASIPVGDGPWGIASNYLGTKVYVANLDTNNVLVIDTLTNTVIDTISVGNQPYVAGNFVEQQSIISVSNSSFYFARTLASEKKEKILTITNQGTVNLNLSQIESDSDEFILEDDNCSNQAVLPQGNCTVGVVFEPQTSGSKTASLTITSNDPDHATTIISLSGKSIYANKFVTKKAKSKEVLIKENRKLYGNNLTLKFTKYPKELKKTKYYLQVKKYKKYFNASQLTTDFLKRYIKLNNSLDKYSGKIYKLKLTFKYTQKEFKNLKKRNRFAKEKNLRLKYFYNDDEWKILKANLFEKKNTLVYTTSNLWAENIYFAIGLK